MDNVRGRLKSLDAGDLLMQFKVMQALGYKSLLDPEFRREIENPYMKLLYFKLVAMQEMEQYKFFSESLKNAVDTLSFFADPELYKQVKEANDRARLADPETAAVAIKEAEDKLHKAERNYTAPSAEDQKKIQAALNNSKPQRTFS